MYIERQQRRCDRHGEFNNAAGVTTLRQRVSTGTAILGGTGGGTPNHWRSTTRAWWTQTGTLQINLGGANGIGTGQSGSTYSITSGAVLDLPGGTTTFNAGSTLSGAGKLRMTGATVNFNGAASPPRWNPTWHRGRLRHADGG